MKTKKEIAPVQHTGSTFDSFLEEEGIKEEVEAVAINRVWRWQLAEARRKSSVSRS